MRYIIPVNRGVMRFRCSDASASIADLTAAIKVAPEEYQAYRELATELARQGRSAAAPERFAQAIARNPHSAPLYRARADLALLQRDPTVQQIDAALTDLEMALRFELPGNPVRARDLANRAWRLERAGRLSEALSSNDLASVLVPDYSAALQQRIDVLIRLKRYDEAARSCDAARSVGAQRSWLYKFRALTRELKNDHAGAAADYSEALRQAPDDPELLIRRGWAYLAAGTAKLALLDFDRSVARDRSSAVAYSGRGTARASLGMPREAADDAEESLRRGRPEARLLYAAARIYALAAPSLANEPGKNRRSAETLAQSFEDRAVSLLNEAVQRQPSSKREAYVRDMVFADPVLGRLRRRIRVTVSTATAGNNDQGSPALVQRIEP